MLLIKDINAQVTLDNHQSVTLFAEILIEQLIKYVIMEIKQDVQKIVSRIQNIHVQVILENLHFVQNVEMENYQV